MNHQLVTAPAENPVSVAEAKSHCRVDGTLEDAWFATAIAAATRLCEELCDRAFVTQTWKLGLDAFPVSANASGCCCSCDSIDRPTGGGGAIVLPRARATSITHLKYYDTDGVLQTLDSGIYQLDDMAEPGRVTPAPGQVWPATQTGRVNAVQVTYTCGYGAAADVDPRAKQAVLFIVNHWYENRGAVLVGSISKEIENSTRALLAQLWPGRMW